MSDKPSKDVVARLEEMTALVFVPHGFLLEVTEEIKRLRAQLALPKPGGSHAIQLPGGRQKPYLPSPETETSK